MQALLATPIGKFRIIAFLEGCSYLLLGITMPLKYYMNMPLPNYIVGMAHGVLFMLYMAMLLWVAFRYKWAILKIFWGFVASLVPFGTFVADRLLFSKEEADTEKVKG